MTPMIDVVFLLIIFFLVSSHLARRETRHPVELPVASTAKFQTSESAAITITVDSLASVWIGGELATLPQLESRIMQRMQRDRQAGSADGSSDRPDVDGASQVPADAIVRVRVDRNVTYAVVEQVLAMLSRLGIENVSLVTQGHTR